MRTAAGLCMVGLWSLYACGEGHGPTAPGGPQNGSPSVTVRYADASAVDEDDAGPIVPVQDAGHPASDGGTKPRATCDQVEALHSSGGDTPNLTSVDTPADFSVTRETLTWNGDCTNPMLILQFSDGTCPSGYGHELDIQLSMTAIQNGTLRLANNDVFAGNPNISVLYTRPDRLKLNGRWGTCGTASGLMVFLEAPDLIAGSLLQARYSLLLAPCDGSTTNTPIEVDGAFKLTLNFNLETVCSGTTP